MCVQNGYKMVRVEALFGIPKKNLTASPHSPTTLFAKWCEAKSSGWLAAEARQVGTDPE